MKRFRHKVLLAASVFILVLVFLSRTNMPELAGHFHRWIDHFGTAGVIVFGVIYGLSSVLFFPGSWMNMASGAIFGWGWGIIAALAGAALGAIAGYGMGHWMLRSQIEHWSEKHPKLKAVDHAISRQGGKIIFLLRLSPFLPFGPSNLFYGSTAIRIWPYFLASMLGMLPGILIQVYFGAVGRKGLQAVRSDGGAQFSALEWSLMIFGFICSILAAVLITRLAKKALKEQELDFEV